MIFHVQIYTHSHRSVSLYFEQLPTKDNLLEAIDSIILQYENGKTGAKTQYGYNWDWQHNYGVWKRAFKVVERPTQQEFDNSIAELTHNMTLSTDELDYTVKLYSRYSNGYYIYFTAVRPLTGTNDPRLSHNIVRSK